VSSRGGSAKTKDGRRSQGWSKEDSTQRDTCGFSPVGPDPIPIPQQLWCVGDVADWRSPGGLDAWPPPWGGGVLPASCAQAARRNATNKLPPPESNLFVTFSEHTRPHWQERALFNVKCDARAPRAPRTDRRPASPIPSRPPPHSTLRECARLSWAGARYRGISRYRNPGVNIAQTDEW
jgi:hypothetical protein